MVFCGQNIAGRMNTSVRVDAQNVQVGPWGREILSASGENVVLTPKLTVQLRCIKTWSKLGSEAALSVTEIANATFLPPVRKCTLESGRSPTPRIANLGDRSSECVPKIGSPSPGATRNQSHHIETPTRTKLSRVLGTVRSENRMPCYGV